MEPTYSEGMIIWIYTWAYLFSKPKIGDIVVVKAAGKSLLKRILKIDNEGIVVGGDNQADSLDSRKLGKIKFSQLIGKVLLFKKI